jgi:hypothetical protein
VPTVQVGDKVNTKETLTFQRQLGKPKLDMTVTGDGISVVDLLDPPQTHEPEGPEPWKNDPQIIYKGTWINDDKINIFTPDGSLGGKPSSTHVRLGSHNTFHDDSFTSDAEGKSYLTYKVEIAVNLTVSHYNSQPDYEAGKVSSSRNYLKQKIVLFSKVPVYSETPKLIIQSTISNSFENKPESSLVAEIQGPADAAGFVILTGSGMDPMKQPLLLGPDGSTRITFIHTFRGEVTLLVEVGELTAERKINVG